jgi:type II secretory pathway pseudopilin PulG
VITTNNNRTDDGSGGEARKGSPVILISVVILVLIIFAALIVPNFMRARNCGSFTQCQSNCKNIGTALEMYSTDHKGHYPPSITSLTPKYLKLIPTCYKIGRDTYSTSYSVYVARNKGEADAYTFFCSGSNHLDLGVSANYPQYNSVQGLTAK